MALVASGKNVFCEFGFLNFIAVTLVWLIWEPRPWQDYLLDIFCWKTSYWYIGYMVRCYILYWLLARFIPHYKSWVMLAIGFSTLFYLGGVQGEQGFSFVTGVLISERGKKIDEHLRVPLKWVALLFFIAVCLLAFKQSGIYRAIESDILINMVQTPMKWTFAMGIILGLAYCKPAINSKFLLLSGVISYELYLVHYPFYSVIDASPWRFSILWVFSYVVSYLFYLQNTYITGYIKNVTK